MVTEWGMSEKLGNIFLGGSGEVFLGRDYSQHTAYSEAIAGQIDEEVKQIIDQNYQRALEILKSNKSILDNMVKVLYEKNTIYTEEVDMLFDGKSAEEIIKRIDERNAKKEEYKKIDQPQVVVPQVNQMATTNGNSEEEKQNTDNSNNSDEVKH